MILLCSHTETATGLASRSGPTVRREFLKDALAVSGFGLVTTCTPTRAGAENLRKPLILPKPLKMIDNRDPTESTPFFVQSDSSATLSPKLVGVSSQSAIQYVSSPNVRSLWLGEHHNSLRDHQLQISILQDLEAQWKASIGASSRGLVVGLEAVQQRFQPVLDDYIGGKIEEEELYTGTEWKTRWFWPFDRYLPVFQFCRERQIPLLALSCDSESLERCEIGGLSALSSEEKKQYLPDAKGFNAFTNTTAFREYIAYEIKKSYELHDDMGILGTTVTGKKLETPMTFGNFFASRLLRDEAMATRAARWLRSHPNGRLVGLVGSDHVKFSCGVPSRTARLLQEPQSSVKSIMLNPTPIDTARDATDVQQSDIILQIRFAAIAGRSNDPPVRRSVTGGNSALDVEEALAMRQIQEGNQGVLPVADFFWFSPGYQDINGYQNNNYLI